jgi:O-antigen/teichoic acid export membrane protein
VKIQNKMGDRLKLFADDSLTKKASLNALEVALDYGARLLVGFVTTPLMVLGLGQYFYGAWQILNRLIGYISPSSGRPTQALKWAIARDQASTDYQQKQNYVGSAFIVWVIFLPLMTVLGAFLVWMAPAWLKAAPEQYLQIRLCTGLLVANLAMTSLATIPTSVLQGENLGYKRMGLTTATVLSGGVFVWLAMRFKTGLIGLAGAALITTVITGAVFFMVTRSNAKWFKVAFPPFRETRRFLGLSAWFLGWNLVMNLMTASDVVILGFLISPEAVTDYSLSKYAPETMISFIALMNLGITPGLGGIIGARQFKKAADIRAEMMTLTWLVTTAVGATILAWNRPFLHLWVGQGHYVGPVAGLFITLVVTQFVMIRCDAGIIDISLDLRRKVLMGLLSSLAAIAVAGVLVGVFKFGVVGLCVGMIVGRLLLSVEYPSIVGRFLGVSRSSQFLSSLRPALVTLVLYVAASWLDIRFDLGGVSGLKGWIRFLVGAGMTAVVFLAAAFYSGLSGAGRKTLIRRLRALKAPSGR